MAGDQALFPMGPLTNTPKPEGTLELGLLQWGILIGSVIVFVVLVTLIIRRIRRQRREPLLHSADERLLRQRNAPQDVINALGTLGRARQRGEISEAKYAELRTELLSGL